MGPTKEQEKLFFEFCGYSHNYKNYEYYGHIILSTSNYKSYKYYGNIILSARKNIYKIEIYVINGNSALFQYYFILDKNLNIENIIKDDLLTFKLGRNINNKWTKFLRKKKLEKLRRNETN